MVSRGAVEDELFSSLIKSILWILLHSCFHLTFTTFWHLDWCNGAHCFCARNFVENHKMFSTKHWVFSLAFHHQYWLSVDSNALCVSGSVWDIMTVQRCFFFFFCPRRQSGREKTLYTEKTCVSVLRGKVIPGGNSRETDNILLVWREKLHGNSLTTPPFIFSDTGWCVYRWGDAVKKVGRDFSGGVFVDFSSLPFWLLKGCRDQLLLTFNGPWKKCYSLFSLGRLSIFGIAGHFLFFWRLLSDSLWANWSGVYFLDAGWGWGGRHVCSQCHDELLRFLIVLVSQKKLLCPDPELMQFFGKRG